MLLQELETQLLALTPTEKAEAIRLLTQSLNNSCQELQKLPTFVAAMLALPKLAFLFGCLKVFAAKVQAMPNFYNFIPI